MARRRAAAMVVLGLLACSGGAWATVSMGDGDPTGGAWLHDWGTIGTLPGWDPPSTSGTRLDVLFDDGTHNWAEDWKQTEYPIPSPGGLHGEEFDVEYLALTQDSTNYYFLAILSTGPDLVKASDTIAVSVGDLAINPTTTYNAQGKATSYTAGYGVKLAGANQGHALEDVEFGWGVQTSGAWNDSTAELRNPAYQGTSTRNPGGYYPGQTDPSYVNPYDWASNFAYLDGMGGYTEAVEWHQLLTGSDGPAGYSFDTWAVEVAISKSHLGSVGPIHNFSVAVTCLNDGMTSGHAPELPPTLLALALPAIGLLVRRAKSR